jgi:hypothetical protein
MFDEEEEYPEYQPPQRRISPSVGHVVQVLSEYAQTLEREKSNREEIERKRRTALSVIRTEREVLLHYLNHRFGERLALYQQYFTLIDTALERQQEDAVRMALETILNIYQDNPCTGLEEFKQQFEAISEVIHI